MIGWKPKSTNPRVASVRLRCLEPMRELQSNGFEIELFRPGKQYDAVIFSKLYDDASIAEALALKERGTRIIFDLCDNHFVHQDPDVQTKLRRQLVRMIGLADGLVASTPALKKVMLSHLESERPIEVIGDPVENVALRERNFLLSALRKQQLKKLLVALRADRENGVTGLVWFGIHGGPNAEFGMRDLLKIQDVMESLNSRHPLSLTVISNSRRAYREVIRPFNISTRYLAWSPETAWEAIAAHSIAVIPVTENEFTKCKTNNRVAVALSAGVAVIADPIPSYQEFASAIQLNRWAESLETYLTDPEARAGDVSRGREIVRQICDPAVIGAQWRRFLETMVPARSDHA